MALWSVRMYEPEVKARKTEYEYWNYKDTVHLARFKLETVSDEEIFLEAANQHFASYYKPLVPWTSSPDGNLRRKIQTKNSQLDRRDLSEAQNDVDVRVQ